MAIDQIVIETVISRLSTLFGLPIEGCEIRRGGIAGSGMRIAGLMVGKGLEVALIRTVSSVAAVVMPEDSAGGLVRRLGQWALNNPDSWRSSVQEASNEMVLTVAVNHETLDDPMDLPNSLWRSFSVECWARRPARTADEIVEVLVEVAGPALALALGGLEDLGLDVDAPTFEPLPEGAVSVVEVNRYERSPVNRLRCINHYGARCWVCEIEFGILYGPAAAGLIEVHHRYPVAMMGADYTVDPISDLVPLCSNCHSVVHRKSPPYEPSEVRGFLGLPPKLHALPEFRKPDVEQ